MSAYHLSYDKALKRQINGLPGKLRQEAKRRIADLARDPAQPKQSNCEVIQAFTGCG